MKRSRTNPEPSAEIAPRFLSWVGWVFAGAEAYQVRGTDCGSHLLSLASSGKTTSNSNSSSPCTPANPTSSTCARRGMMRAGFQAYNCSADGATYLSFKGKVDPWSSLDAFHTFEKVFGCRRTSRITRNMLNLPRPRQLCSSREASVCLCRGLTSRFV